MAIPLFKALINKIGCNRLLLVNSPAAAAAILGLKQLIRNNNLQIRFHFSTRTVFNEWCKEHGKKYSSEKIEKLAFKNFEENYKIATEHNAKDHNSSLLGLTHIMDRCPEFWRPKFMASRLNKERDEEGDGVGPVIECRSVKEWKKHFKKGTKSGKLVVVDFSNELVSSRAIDPKYAEENADRGILFLKVDLLKLQSVAKEWNVECDEPTFLFLKDGVEMGRLSSVC